MKECIKPFIEKLTSGKFLFTIICALVFAVLAINKTLPNDKVMEVVLIVVYAYFTKSTTNGNPKSS